MYNSDVTELIKKADELKTLFTLGQRVIPFLDDIIVFVRDIQPLIDDINKSIAENLKNMPLASEQLSKVNEANEIATNEIMDVVDGLIFKVDVISENVNNIASNGEKHLGNAIKLLEILYKAIEQNSNLKAILPQLSSSIHTLKNSNSSNNEIVKSNADTLESIKNDSNSIMMSLQVQDINSQQLAAVNHTLEIVQQKLGLILKHFHSSDLTFMMSSDNKIQDENYNDSNIHIDLAFDLNAVESLNQNSNRQNNVDEIIIQHLNNVESINNEILNIDETNNIYQNNNEILEIDETNNIYQNNNEFESQDVEFNFLNNEHIISNLSEDFNQSVQNTETNEFTIINSAIDLSSPITETNSSIDGLDKIENLENIGDDIEILTQDDIDKIWLNK